MCDLHTQWNAVANTCMLLQVTEPEVQVSTARAPPDPTYFPDGGSDLLGGRVGDEAEAPEGVRLRAAAGELLHPNPRAASANKNKK